ncbi:MAG TPA: hypothetical protein VNO54_25245 [Streptosporangiaceae bacterium]|nr:hypothetical protein [Streptosporangiaceae bacterium]
MAVGARVVLQRVAERGGLVIGSRASAALRSWAMPFLRAGEAAGEFPEVASVD